LILVIAAFLPTKMRHRRFADFGFNRIQIPTTLVVLGGTCIAVFPIAFCGLWVLKSYNIALPLPSALPREPGWVGWLFYQFMYVAVAEEVFFRGYLQSNILRLAQPLIEQRLRLKQWVSIVLSAVCFAIVHVIVQGRFTAALTFLPGLVLGWLFIRTRSLLAPILFHGLANVCYVLTVGLFE
ncbi:MAG: CPBP family intramembrane metalloprotease, partial [Phycisphaerales bacterium]